MAARVLQADRPEDLARAAAALAAGELVAFPTDTVYGLGARAFDPAAVAAIYVAKERPAEKGIPVLLADAADLGVVALGLSGPAEALAAAFWPGALTLVVARRPELPEIVSATPTVAVRVPDHAVTRALIRAAGVPLATTSANRSGEPSLLAAEDVVAALGARIPWIVDGGRAPGGVPSTIVDCSREPPRVLRHGALTLAALRAVVPGLEG